MKIEGFWGGEGLFGLGIFECEGRGCTYMIGGIQDIRQNVKVPPPNIDAGGEDANNIKAHPP